MPGVNEEVLKIGGIQEFENEKAGAGQRSRAILMGYGKSTDERKRLGRNPQKLNPRTVSYIIFMRRCLEF